MGTKVTSWQSDDGVLFTDEGDMLRHEVKTALVEKFPELKSSMTAIMDNIERISEIIEPLASYFRKNHPEAPEETTREPEDLGGCDCSALMAGNGGPHAISCPMSGRHDEYVEIVRKEKMLTAIENMKTYRDSAKIWLTERGFANLFSWIASAPPQTDIDFWLNYPASTAADA